MPHFCSDRLHRLFKITLHPSSTMRHSVYNPLDKHARKHFYEILETFGSILRRRYIFGGLIAPHRLDYVVVELRADEPLSPCGFYRMLVVILEDHGGHETNITVETIHSSPPLPTEESPQAPTPMLSATVIQVGRPVVVSTHEDPAGAAAEDAAAAAANDDASTA